MIARSDVDLFRVVDSAKDAVQVLYDFYGGVPPDQVKGRLWQRVGRPDAKRNDG